MTLPPFVPTLQRVQTAAVVVLGALYACVALRSPLPLLRGFCAASALKAACSAVLPGLTLLPLYSGGEAAILLLAAITTLEVWWLEWKFPRLQQLAAQSAITITICLTLLAIPAESDPAWQFDRTRRQVWLAILLFCVVASFAAWWHGHSLSRRWGSWVLYVASHVLPRLFSYASYETLETRWTGYFATAYAYDVLAAAALYGLSEPGGGSSPV